MKTFWACSKQWRTDVPRWRECCIALCTILAFLTLLAVSGPHLVHHLTELHPQEHHHTQDGHHPPAEHAPPRPDCLVLFLMQHTPVAEAGEALLPILLFCCRAAHLRTSSETGRRSQICSPGARPTSYVPLNRPRVSCPDAFANASAEEFARGVVCPDGNGMPRAWPTA